MELLVGIDIGTSGTKVAIYGADGRNVSQATVEYPMYQPRNGWAEQDPNDWRNAVVEGVRLAIKKGSVNADSIKGVGLTGQMHGLVMLDKAGVPLRNAIIWCDQRTSKECDKLNELVGADRLVEITANPALTGFTASKILWVMANEPEIYERCAHILLPKDYIRYILTGDFATEVSDASGMQLMNIAKRDWSDEVLGKIGVDRALLGDMYESTDVTGRVSASAAAETGLTAGTPVVGGAGDNAGAAIGMGVYKPGSAFTTLGSSGVVYAVSNEIAIDMKRRVHALCASVPGKWTVMSCTQAAGLSLQWYRDQFCSEEKSEAARLGVDPYKIMDDKAAAVGKGSDGLIYLPYLMGERSPHPDPYCRGVFFGLSASHTRANMIRAVMEGVAFSQLECVDVFREMGVEISDMMACGGGSKSALWKQMLADLYQLPISSVAADEGPAFGAAILASVGAKLYDSVEDACSRIIKKSGAVEPTKGAYAQYEKYYSLYKKLYLSLKDNFYDLSNAGN